MACDTQSTVEVRVCGRHVIPGERTRLVEVDGEVVDVRDLVDAGMLEPADEEPVEGALDPSTPIQMDAIRIVARDAEFEELQAAVHELSSGDDGIAKGFDRTVDFPPPAGTEWIQVEGLLGSVPVHWLTRRIGALADLDRVQMPLSESCYGIECAFGQTCVAGGCELAPDEAGGLACPLADGS